jgi:hypothetical protein
VVVYYSLFLMLAKKWRSFSPPLKIKLLSDKDWKAAYEKTSEKAVGKKLEPKDPKDWNWDDFVATAVFFTQQENGSSPTKYGTALQLKNLIFNTMIWEKGRASCLPSFIPYFFNKDFTESCAFSRA